MTFTLVLDFMVSGKNQVGITRTGRRYPNARFVEFRKQVARQILNHNQLNFSLQKVKSLRCDIKYWPNDKRTRDLPGMTDAIYHCLEQAGVIASDGQIKLGSFTTMEQAQEVRLEVILDEA